MIYLSRESVNNFPNRKRIISSIPNPTSQPPFIQENPSSPSKNPITGIPAEGKEFQCHPVTADLISEPLKQNSVKPFSTKGRNNGVDGTNDETPRIERHQQTMRITTTTAADNTQSPLALTNIDWCEP
ncbi:hypothetical protein CEXT_739091 [Caerostris extrusa]|uniref:Uncharacterized protein n=1 Tax=Caerostris extrusa TaxID=172846 RepID=A0AAV4R7K2_CAEEX|nr:hypothetical protein CEXT_739091 [Caerostris extrusa]